MRYLRSTDRAIRMRLEPSMDARRMVGMVARRQDNEENIRFEGTEADRAVGVLDERVELVFTLLR